MARQPKGTPTALNVGVLARLFEYGARTRIPNRIASVSVSSMRRCLRAGLCDVEGDELVLTPTGVAAVASAWRPGTWPAGTEKKS